MIDRYYEEELRYLTEAGKEFARAHPEQARLLNIDSITDRDPYVERLFEGFAFIAARIREKLDDELPELVRSLFEVMWPHFLRPIPSLTMLEFRARAGLLQKTALVPAKTPIVSNPLPGDNLRCRFETCFPVELQPLRLEKVLADHDATGHPAIRFKFAVEAGAEFDKLNLDTLRIFLHADPAAAFQLHLALTTQIESVRVFPANQRIGGQELISAAGFDDDESILPPVRSEHPAYQLLHEYFSYREKFLLIRLHGFKKLALEKGASHFDFLCTLSKPLPDGLRFSEENFRLYCTPAINLFDHDAEPVRADHTRENYRVIASSKNREGYEIHSIEGVAGIEVGTGRQWTYRPAAEFRFEEDSMAKGIRTFSWGSEFGPSGQWEATVTLHGVSVNNAEPRPENLSFEARATNGKRARELAENDVSVPTDTSPSQASFGNITKPTIPLYPPRRTLYLWKLLSHLSHGKQPLDSVEELRDLLRLYDWTEQDANRRRIDGIQSIDTVPKDFVSRGAIVRGLSIRIELLEGNFIGKGDAHLFGQVLYEFFRQYVTINAMIELSVLLLPSQEIYRWTPHSGTQSLL